MIARLRLARPERHLNEQPVDLCSRIEHCLALDKPAGQFTQGRWAPEGECTLETAVRRYLDPADPDSVYLGIVHRLDRPTSGVILWAKTEKAARRLSIQFQKRLASKNTGPSSESRRLRRRLRAKMPAASWPRETPRPKSGTTGSRGPDDERAMSAPSIGRRPVRAKR